MSGIIHFTLKKMFRSKITTPFPLNTLVTPLETILGRCRKCSISVLTCSWSRSRPCWAATSDGAQVSARGRGRPGDDVRGPSKEGALGPSPVYPRGCACWNRRRHYILFVLMLFMFAVCTIPEDLAGNHPLIEKDMQSRLLCTSVIQMVIVCSSPEISKASHYIF